MRVDKVNVDVLRVPVDQAYVAAGRSVDANWHVLARVGTTDGIEGFGYIVYPRQDLMRAVAAATQELGASLLGAEVLDVEATWAALVKRGSWVGPGGLLHCAIAPLDIALWDAAGKTLGQPLYRLLGGYRDRIAAYASDGLWYNLSLDEVAAAASHHASQGFRAVKLRLGGETQPAAEVQRVRAVRQAVGPDVQILVDATETWNRPQALQTGRALQEAGIAWLEDPVNHQDLEGLSQLSSLLEVPVAAGEHLYGLREFRDLMQARAVHIAIIDLARIGGITPWRKVASLAQAFETLVCGHVVPEIHVHLLAAVPNACMVEHVPRSASILCEMPVMENGQMVAPQLPGLGLSLDEGAVQRYRL